MAAGLTYIVRFTMPDGTARALFTDAHSEADAIARVERVMFGAGFRNIRDFKARRKG